ncbi:FeoC-like transcriptional regulator [Azotobacter chroococcum]|uniref:Ferrous iron transport protein, feoC-like protein n=1 Tax=Azotobacter chroococcum NCIMB 8003 TaxID=1328314 RepID=A0A0C4WMZ5_9GAMM|nr:FeoC-like transcriptional regulator [Azotobacter chroococcum]AJE21821.1 Ferrous iron transport protein, feoC-like protein [Azotobacter chroococcum NCIMB 8003]TBW02639.1 sugar metabolism transcriptional regulator [Azotobacter chroococcum]
MILAEIGQYLRQHGRASLRDLATATGSTPEAVEAMLATLARKGRVRRLPAGSTCGTACCQCDPATLALYEWIGE